MYFLIFILGSIMGSFYYCMGERLCNNKSLIKPSSHCEYCGHILKWYELIPLISYIFLRGKCSKCQNKLSIKYFLSEILTGVLFLISYLRFGLTYQFIVMLVISSLLVLIFITDFKYLIILDSPLVVSCLILFIARFYLFGIKNALINLSYGLFIFLAMLFLSYLGKFLFKKEALGGGDIKLSFVIGMILGVRFGLLSIVFSTFLALPYAIASMILKKDNVLPYGPFLISSVFIVYFFLEKFSYILKLFVI